MAAFMNRRRAIGILAAASGLSLLPFGSAVAAPASAVDWRGQALGAPAELRIHHHDRAHAQALVEQVAAEVRRLERIFSLYREDSVLVSLNRQHSLVAPPEELVDLLAKCRGYWTVSEGAFDPTIQSLWSAYQRHFSAPNADAAGPSARVLRDARRKVGFDRVVFSRDRVELTAGMALTLNGVAQGYITDRIVALLRAGGIGSCLVDMGECRTVGMRPDGNGWRVGIADPDNVGRQLAVLDVVDRAVATTSASGFHFDSNGHFNHLLDPRTGLPAHRYRSLTVVAAEAADADALSTAFSLMGPTSIAAVAKKIGGIDVRIAQVGGPELVMQT